MSLPQGDGPSGSSIVTLHVSPRTKASDSAIRDIGANSKIIIRLLDHEPVFKLYEHLMAKWKLAERSFDVVFFFNGTRACLSDQVSQYLENGKPKVIFEFELIPSSFTDSELVKQTTTTLDTCTPTTTASSTPVPGSPAVAVEPTPSEEPPVRELVLPPDSVVAPVTSSNRKSSKSSSRSKPKTLAVPEEPPAAAPPLPVEPSPPIAALSPAEYILPSSALVIPSRMSSPPDSVYKEMLDRERDIFMTLLESQARWMSQMQAQMTNTCLAVQENAFRMLSRGSDKEDDVHEFKKQRKQ
jgi:hypothetical protein